jgi:hypothetical protein
MKNATDATAKAGSTNNSQLYEPRIYKKNPRRLAIAFV